MRFQCGVVSDVGTTRKINQDSVCIHSADTIIGKILFAVVCDGMGGLSDGEYASKSMIESLEEWYQNRLPAHLASGLERDLLHTELAEILNEHNKYLIEYGNDRETQLGTTVSALLILPGRYFGIHVGDSRIYAIEKKRILQLTNDHSRVMQEVRLGILTPTEAERDTRKNQLLQCIGARGGISPEFFEGDVTEETTFLLCSDGFIHKISKKEMWKSLRPNRLRNDGQIEKRLLELVEENKRRMETDNITAMAVRVLWEDED